jgi:tetratricopeptide (TPR) repeat protein
MATFDQRQQTVGTQYNADHIAIYAQATPRPVDPETLAAAERQLAALPLETIPDPAPLPRGSRMLLTHNPLFVGRADELKVLATAFRGGTTMPMAAVTGLGGVGKSQLAVEFVHRYGQFFAGGAFWLSFADPQGVPAEIAACGGVGYLELRPDFAGLSLEEQVRLVLGAWQSPLPRLLIFDNCEETGSLATWRPPTGGCRILVTSRCADWDPALGVQTLPLDVLPRAQSVALLGRFRPDWPADDATLHTITAELGDLPLALHLAGNFLRAYRHAPFGTPKAYVTQLSQEKILEHPSLTGEGATFSPTGHEQHVARTFGVSYTQLNVADPLDARALALLARVAYFAPGELIPRDLLLATLQQTDADFQTALQDEKALARLVALGLVEEEAEGALRMHRLLTRFVRALSGDAAAQASVEDTLLDVFRRVEQSGTLIDARRLEAHMRAAADLAIPRRDERAVALCHHLGNYLRLAADYTGAQYYLEHALAVHEALLGKDHPETALDLNDLGYVLYHRRDYAGARAYLERALPLWEQQRDDANMAATLDNLAQLHNAEGDSVGALERHKAALTIREQVVGPTDTRTAVTLHGIGQLLMKQGDLAGARQYHERGLAIRERLFRKPHRSTAASLTMLAVVLQRQGDLPRAREYCERGLAIWEQVLGPTHPSTLTTLVLLLDILYELGEAASARTYLDRVPVLPEEVGISDADTLNNLGYAFWVRGGYTEALRYYHKALAIFERALGKAHPDLSVTLNNLGMALVPLGDYEGSPHETETIVR